MDHGTFSDLLRYSHHLTRFDIVNILLTEHFSSPVEPVKCPSVRTVNAHYDDMMQLGHDHTLLPTLVMRFPGLFKWEFFWGIPNLKSLGVDTDGDLEVTIDQLDTMPSTAFSGSEILKLSRHPGNNIFEGLNGFLRHVNTLVSIDISSPLADNLTVQDIVPSKSFFAKIV
ncbi:hypothetical protein BG015_008286 [Linnemannia schmuckeri]|uniref:Uncharacterized protein n=1 Tax=Linnemannia schmuckeri TaxID=64567 RepID=A0A9P5VAF7_9FUNG|nr:hypothetical protein BG015_008286 [Linnemannia schmuckeri]